MENAAFTQPVEGAHTRAELRDAYWIWDHNHAVEENETLLGEGFKVLGGGQYAHPMEHDRAACLERGIASTSHALTGVMAQAGVQSALIAQNGGGSGTFSSATVEIKSTNDIDRGFGTLLSAHTSSGSCVIDLFGNFACTGKKSAIVPISNHRKVALYAVESPENWFEDFGSAFKTCLGPFCIRRVSINKRPARISYGSLPGLMGSTSV